ncbi:MAG: aldose 1-epimerase, partial [Rubrivivax sp.]
MTPSIIELRAGALRLALRPDLGGCLAGVGGGDLLGRPTTEPAQLQRPRLSGSYPLVPYSNRLGHRHFRWQGREYTTQPNFDDSPHSVHGVGWLRPWEVVSQSAGQASIRLVHPGDADWPFAFEAKQTFGVDEEGLHLSMTIENTAAVAAPVGLGWPPYFPKRSRSRLHIEVSDRWESDPTTQLPTRRVAQPVIDGDVSHRDFDHFFEGWLGAARLRDERLRVSITSSLPYLVVFTPPMKDYCCVEPVSHVSNAIHMAEPARHGLRTLQPGEAFEAWMRLDVQP